jgi:hypothetical protein
MLSRSLTSWRGRDFEDFVSIEREVIAEGFAEGVHWLERPGIRQALTEICKARRGVETSHKHLPG